MTEPSLEGVVGPILESIGYDFTRLSELNRDDLAAVLLAQSTANELLKLQFVAVVGSVAEADRLISAARDLPDDEARARREQYGVAIEREERPSVQLIASHISFGMDILRALRTEAERRVSPMN